MNENLTDKEIKAQKAREWRAKNREHSRQYLKLFMRRYRQLKKAESQPKPDEAP